MTNHHHTLEHDARQHAASLEALAKLPHGFVAHHYPLTRDEHAELARLKACVAAATDAATFVALVHGEAVPASRLNPRIVSHHYARLAHGR